MEKKKNKKKISPKKVIKSSKRKTSKDKKGKVISRNKKVRLIDSPGDNIFDSQLGKTDVLFVSDPEDQQNPSSIQPATLEMNKVEADLEMPLFDGDAEKFQEDNVSPINEDDKDNNKSINDNPPPVEKKIPWWKRIFK